MLANGISNRGAHDLFGTYLLSMYEWNQPKRPKRTWPVHCDMSAFGT